MVLNVLLFLSLHRSPGICFEQERHPRGNMIYSFRIIPYRGSWLEGAFDTNDLIHIYIDRKKRRRKILGNNIYSCAWIFNQYRYHRRVF